MSQLIRSGRKAQRISVNELAERLGVTPGAISQMERSEREGTIKLQTLSTALAALGEELLISSTSRSPLSRFAPARLASSLSQAIDNGDETFALRLITEATDAIRSNPGEITREELESPPPRLPDERWDQFFRAMYRQAMPAGLSPAWTTTRKLPEPWFISKYPALRERARNETPTFLKRLNIYIDERSLSRA
ncbi:helix-turn-helix domain-containing protein [Glaciibacter superstes]|uniref:helix-turn-helix domain-containing protein n=1 Tax=Glaciibacter superstes TaxID=501023 RepID=UPI0003B3B01F|nr:helix-turn-helix domain-containing protein [Glaciibacter superstes]